LPGLDARIRSVPPGQRFTASTTIAELLFGGLVLGDQGRQILRRIEDRILSVVTVLAFDEPAARRFAEVKATLQRRGEPLEDADMQIAAVALTHDLTLVTDNTRHFVRIASLRLENWLA